MKSQPAFVRADRTVHLDPEAAIHVDLAGVVLPRHPEHDHAFRFNDSFEDFRLPVAGISIHHQGERLDYFLHRLVKLDLVRVFGLHLGHQIRNVIFHELLTRMDAKLSRMSYAKQVGSEIASAPRMNTDLYGSDSKFVTRHLPATPARHVVAARRWKPRRRRAENRDLSKRGKVIAQENRNAGKK